jgi:glycine/D-amino acid oxidase-like deaminating enzyme
MTEETLRGIKHQVDIVVVGAGIAGLWTAGVLKRRGYSVAVFERDAIGGVQTFASQGMIHGGQKYTLTGRAEDHALSIAAMPARWQAAFDGCGDLDLAGVDFASDHQVMWPAGGLVAATAVLAAAKLVNAATARLARGDYPEALATIPKFKGPVYQLPEKVMNIKSLVAALARPLAGRIFRGELKAVLPDGQVAFHADGRDIVLHAQAVIVTAGTGNEDALKALRIERKMTQRRPLRQIMVRDLPFALYGHGIVGHPKPRVTVTAARRDTGGYVWYLGGALAEAAAALPEEEAIALALREMADLFPQVDWASKEWATWQGDRAEPHDPEGRLPPGPAVHQRGRVLLAWPAKLTFAPALGDRVLAVLEQHGIRPALDMPEIDWPQAAFGAYPWETATWRKA